MVGIDPMSLDLLDPGSNLAELHRPYLLDTSYLKIIIHIHTHTYLFTSSLQQSQRTQLFIYIRYMQPPFRMEYSLPYQ